MSRTAHCEVWLEAYSLHRSSSSYSSIPGISRAVSLMRDMPRVSYMMSFRLAARLIPTARVYLILTANRSVLYWTRGDPGITSWMVRLTHEGRL